MASANTGAMLRAQVAAATRLLHNEGLLTYSGHLSARAPEGDRFYIQIRTEPRTEVTPGTVPTAVETRSVMVSRIGHPVTVR